MSFELLVVVVDIIMPAMRRAVIMQNRHRQSQRERVSEWESMSKWERAVWVSLRLCMRLRDARLCMRVCVRVCVGGVNEWVNLQAICYKQSAICMTAPRPCLCVCVHAPVFVNSLMYVCLCLCVCRQKHATWIASLQTSRRRLACTCVRVCTCSAYTHTVTELRRRSNGTIKFKWNQEKNVEWKFLVSVLAHPKVQHTHTYRPPPTNTHTLGLYFTHTTLCLFEVSLSFVLLYVGSPLQRVFRVS